MKKPTKSSDGKYHIDGKVFEKLIGSRAQVWHGTAYKTSYGSNGLKKQDIMMNKHHRLVSKKKHNTAKKEKRLEHHGYFTKKGKFGAVKKTLSKKHNKSKKHHKSRKH